MNVENAFIGPQSIQVCHLGPIQPRHTLEADVAGCLCGDVDPYMWGPYVGLLPSSSSPGLPEPLRGGGTAAMALGCAAG